MKKINLKNTNLTVSNIAMGTDSIGSLIDRKLSFELLDRYSDFGGNLIDTAECYAHWADGGTHASEILIGEWMYDRGLRSKTVISTKGGFYLYGKPHRLTRADIEEDLDGSLRRLKTDYIDIYWLHRDALGVCVGEVMEILADAVKSGKVRYIGVSNWSNVRLHEANMYAKAHDLPELIASQIQYSAAYPNIYKNEPDLVIMNDDEYNYFKNSTLTVFAFASQAKGFFAKFLKGGKEALSKKAFDRYYNAETLSRFENLKKIADEKNCSINSIAVAALTNNYDFDTIPIIGCKNINQLDDSLSASDIILSEEEVNFIFNRKD